IISTTIETNDPEKELAVAYELVGPVLHKFITTEDIFDQFEYQKDRPFEFARGRKFDEGYREAVIGASVARKRGLALNDKFQVFHGLDYSPVLSQLHPEVYSVVGVLEPTNTPADEVIWIPIEGIFRMSGHLLADGTEATELGGGEIPDEQKEVSSVMIKFTSPAVGMGRYANTITAINRGDAATIAYPIAQVMLGFLSKMGWITKVLVYIAYLVVGVASFGLLASIYNTMNERRREFAVLRALGARRSTVFTAIVCEAATIAFLGALLGYALYAIVMFVTAYFVREETGVHLDTLAYHPSLVWAPVAMVALGALAGIVPARKAYATDVARTLS
ncbi:MAG: FtsX-like permease family protein, partial [Planctomycetota bacterium]